MNISYGRCMCDIDWVKPTARILLHQEHFGHERCAECGAEIAWEMLNLETNEK